MSIPTTTPRCIAFRVHDDGTTTSRYSDGTSRTTRATDPTVRLFVAPAAPAAPPPGQKPKAAPSLGEQLIALEFSDLPDPGGARSFADLLSPSDDPDTTTTPDLGAQLADMEP